MYSATDSLPLFAVSLAFPKLALLLAAQHRRDLEPMASFILSPAGAKSCFTPSGLAQLLSPTARSVQSPERHHTPVSTEDSHALWQGGARKHPTGKSGVTGLARNTPSTEKREVQSFSALS